MPEIKPNLFLSSRFQNIISTNTDTESPVTSDTAWKESKRLEWDHLIDHRLIEWGRDPASVADEGVEPPTGEIIQLAIMLAQQLRDAEFPPPSSILVDPNGGIVLIFRLQESKVTYHIWDDATIDYCIFQGTSLVKREYIKK